MLLACLIRFLTFILVIDISFTASKTRQTNVHVIFMNHLDVGYSDVNSIGFINNVLNSYFTNYFKQAIQLATSMRSAGFLETFKYTTHPWLLDMYFNCPPNFILSGVKLQCPSQSDKSAVFNAVKMGDIVYHAGPMNMQAENMDSTLFEASLNISKRLDDFFGIVNNHRVLSQRDVPGITIGAIKTLRKNGVSAISIGANPFFKTAAVTPEPFIWKINSDPASEEIIKIFHSGGYPNNAGNSPQSPGGVSRDDCSMLFSNEGSEVLCFSFRTDNTGPPQSIEEVLITYEILRSEFPGANIRASSLSEFVAALESHRSSLRRVIGEEIGDTWIQGVASDPLKMAQHRALNRAFSACHASGRCDPFDPIVRNVTRFLVKPAEHTWGLNSVFDQVNYSNAAFNKARSGSNYLNCETTWKEQRFFNELAFHAARDHPWLFIGMQYEMNALNSTPPTSSDFLPYPDYANPTTCGNLQVAFADDGSINSLISNKNNIWATDDFRLGQFVYRTYNEQDDNDLFRSYSISVYGLQGFGKANVTANANPLSRVWPVTLVQSQQHRSQKCVFLMTLVMSNGIAHLDYGAPARVNLLYNITGNDISLKLYLLGKTPTRLEETLFLQFTIPPALTRRTDCSWALSKLGVLIDPLSLMRGGNSRQHAVDQFGGVFMCSNSDVNMQFNSMDIPIMAPFNQNIPATSFPFLERFDVVDGVAFNLFNNVWDTNYILWYPYESADENFMARFDFSFETYNNKEQVSQHPLRFKMHKFGS